MLAAKAQGLPVSSDGKYTGSENLTIVGISTDPASKASLILQSELQSLGFHVTVRLVSANTYYSKFCENGKSTGAAVCANNAIVKDFPDELGIMPIFAPGSLAPIGTSDVTNAINKAEVTYGKGRAAAWVRANNVVLSHAVSIPYYYGKNVVLTSKNVSVATSPLWSGGSIDFSFAHLK
jgi:ABC-type transport system substrate-binding protein